MTALHSKHWILSPARPGALYLLHPSLKILIFFMKYKCTFPRVVSSLVNPFFILFSLQGIKIIRKTTKTLLDFLYMPIFSHIRAVFGRIMRNFRICDRGRKCGKYAAENVCLAFFLCVSFRLFSMISLHPINFLLLIQHVFFFFFVY